MIIPKDVIWEITKQCNFSCAHCLVDARKIAPKDELSTDEAIDFINLFASKGGSSLSISGGEPTLRKDLFYLLDYAKKLGFKTSCASNGSRFTEDIVTKFKNVGISSIQISVDGANDEQFSEVRQSPVHSFKRAMRAVNLCHEQNVPVCIGAFIHPGNIGSIAEMVDLTQQYGVNVLRLSGFTPLGRGADVNVRKNLTFTDEQKKQFADYIYNYDPQKTGVYIIFDHAFGPVSNGFRCAANTEVFYMKSNGDIYPCPTLLRPEFLMGNIRHNKLEDIFAKPIMKSLRVPDKELKGICHDCKYLSKCHGGCRAGTLAYTGDKYASYPSCLCAWAQMTGDYPDFLEKVTQQNYPMYSSSKQNCQRAAQSITRKDYAIAVRNKALAYAASLKSKKAACQASGSTTADHKETSALSPAMQRRKRALAFAAERLAQIKAKRKPAKVTATNSTSSANSSRSSCYLPGLGGQLEAYYQNHGQKLGQIFAEHELTYILWQSTLRCNLHCEHCVVSAEPHYSGHELTTEEAKLIFEKIAKSFDIKKIRTISISGGEPCLRPDLPEMIRFLKQLGPSVCLDTNGIILGNRPALADELVKAGIDTICFSFDGLSEMHDRQRGKNCYESLMNAIKYFKLNYPQLPIQTVTMVTRKSLHDLPNIFRVLEDLGICFARFATAIHAGRAVNCKESFLSPHDLRLFIQWLSEKRSDYASGRTRLLAEFSCDGWLGRSNAGGFEGIARSSPFYCTAGTNMATIYCDGAMGACMGVPREISVQGDALHGDPKDIWENHYQYFRDRSHFKRDACATCREWPYCQGGSMHQRGANYELMHCNWLSLCPQEDGLE